MAYTLTIPIALGTSKTGLTLKAQLVDTAGADVGSAITTGFVEIGGGQYLWTGSIPDEHRGGVKFLDNTSSEFYAVAAINPEEAENTDTKVSTLVAEVWGYADRQLTGFSQPLAKQVWDVLDADIGGAGTAGERFKKLDVLVSSRSTLTATQVRQEMDSNSLVLNHILQDTDALEQRLTADRATKLDFITGTLALESTLTEMKGTGWTTESLKSLSDSILTRLAAAEYTAPDNAGIAAIKAQTDKLQFTAENDVKATLDGEAVTAATVQDKSGYSLAADQSAVTIGTVNNLGANAKAHVNAEVDAALNTAVPDNPVVGSINERLKTMGDAYTADRAAKLDNLTGPVALEETLTALMGSGSSTETLKAIMDTLITRMPASSYVAPDNASIAAIKAKTDKLNFVGTDVKATLDGEVVETTISDKTGFYLAADQSGVTIGTVNSIGATAQEQVESSVNDALNAVIPEEPLEGSIFERIKALDDAYTAARAAKLDYLMGPVALEATLTAMKGVGWTDQTLVKLGEDILSRLSAAEYTDPDNAGIAAIKAQTDKLRFAGNDVKATLDGETVTASSVLDKAGYSLAADQSGVTVGVVNALGATAQEQVNTEVGAALDAPIGDAPADGSINERIKALDDAYTATRAAKLDFITGAVALEATLAAMKGAGWTVETLKALYDQILLRLPTASYTAPDNAGIAAIKAQTDKLTFTGTDVKATLDGEKVTAQTVEDKTGYSLAADQSDVTIGTVNDLGATAQSRVRTQVDEALNAPIDDAPADGSINERMKALDDAYTAVRAEKLDNLDATVSSRMAESAYTAPDNEGIAAVKAQTDKLRFTGNDVKATLDGETVTASSVQDKTGYSLAADQSGVTIGTVNSLGETAQGQVNTQVGAALDAPIGDAPADGSINERIKAMSDAYTADRAAKLDNLDATVSSRMAESTYTPPDNAGIAAVKAKTDRLQFSDADDVKATLDGEKVTAQTVEDKTGYSLAADQSGVTIGAVNALGATAREQVNTEVDAALDTAIPDDPVINSINERIKALDDAYTAARAAKLDYLDAVVGPVVPPVTGANPVTITLVDTDGAPVPGLTVTVWNDAITARLAYGTTDSNGQVVFNLESGPIKIAVTTTLAWKAVGVTAYTVTDTGAQSVPNIVLTAQSVTPPALANQIIGVLDTYDATGALKGNVAICIEMVKGPGTAGQSHDTTVNTHTSNASGRLEVAHLKGAEYRARRGNSDMDWVYYTAPSTGTSFSLPEILGRP